MTQGRLPRTVLVAGSSSGIGRATADRLAAGGWSVVGGSRRGVADNSPSSEDSTSASGWRPVHLDVTSDDSVEAAVAATLAHLGRIDVVVHCAGRSVAGAIEDVTISEAEQQFATNYFGVVRMLRAVLPVMRRQGGGRIVVVGSIGGLIALPFIGHYSGSKFALEGMIEAIRHEVRPFGIEIAVVHPGDIRTAISQCQLEGSNTGPGSPYSERFRIAVEAYDKAVREAREPEVIAKLIERLLARRRLPPRVLAGTPFERAGVVMRQVLPRRWFEAMIARTYGF